MRRVFVLLFAALCIVTAGPAPSLHAQAYKVTNLFSDGSVTATTMDPNFLNPWGISVSGTWWISAANSGFNFVVSSTTNASPFKVAVAPGSSSSKTGSPTGSVTTSGASGMVLSNGGKASFLFSTLDGTISGWNGALGQATPTTLIAVNNASAGACYPGLALLNANATTSYVLAPNFGTANKIEVYDQTFKPSKLTGSFTDPNLPSNYGPWSIHILNNQIWVAYAVRSGACQWTPGVGNGIVDVFDLNGNFVARAVTGGNLNAPWGVAFAPSTGFGIFSGDLLIGNFGDGKINVYDPKTYAYIGQLMDSTGKSLVYASLWDLLTGGTPVLNSTAVSGGTNTTVYFTAGLANEAHGLLGAITSATTTGATPTFGFTASTGATTVTNGSSSAPITVSVAPVNGFSGGVTFFCTGLPSGATCSFSPSTVNVASNAVSTTQVTIDTSGMGQKMGSLDETPFHLYPTFSLGLASLLPFSLLLMRRRLTLRERISLIVPLLLLSLGTSALMLGCSSNSTPPAVTTPTGTSQVSVVAMSANTGVQQSTSIALTVQ
ncbi:MAG TPA: TIGR03118 family protein [Acidobacteriaceae bacterium]|nr:TIGR03118 family protein [Acidobacteriaceae bacterium]